MSFQIIHLLLDFGLMVLIWIIQRIVYPSFIHYGTENLVGWHKEYIRKLNPIVIPLMFGQLGIYIYQVVISVTAYTIISLGIVLVIWISTFFQFVPIHSNISKGKVSEKMLRSLVKKNWIRTLLWTTLFLYSMVNHSIA
ncbi:hypothetical protein [Flagellimonas eckloniae]|uniref:Uncharacterized protein n=1 Tax=Flagellimonas eckloniae TaxID=346185 RepID=A0A0Q1DJI0_9FLAO|nr:hypothetical protein [Allomuricauda eckloniae]KQC28944.1 hypothetical protein AAY42_02825 [Allomuricauda eckloniae]